MLDLSLNIMDIIENSVSAHATEIKILIEMTVSKNRLRIDIKDNGIGMDEKMVDTVQDPFYTSKIQRVKKVGLGIPLFKQSVEMCNGTFTLRSKKGVGTEIDAVFQYDHIDRMPLGKLADTFCTAILGHPEVDFDLELKRIFLDKKVDYFHFSTREVKAELGDVPITYPDVIMFIQETINENIKKIQLEEI
ncbi:MAG TPA: ATP-binding protein [Candidatus Cloacimonadota bacterium]|nr:ATP-binding protein [Candidatus Cloacimonadota bacterium]